MKVELVLDFFFLMCRSILVTPFTSYLSDIVMLLFTMAKIKAAKPQYPTFLSLS